MSISKLLSLGVLSVFCAAGAVACSTSTDPSPSDDPSAEVQDQDLRASITSCKVDDDCVAVPRGGCCSNGWMEAVNKHHVRAYENATKCTVHNMMCPMYMVHDTRVAQCNTGTNKCEMVEPTDIRCGGFTRNPHSCPDGYSCDFAGVVPDVPGKCVEDTDGGSSSGGSSSGGSSSGGSSSGGTDAGKADCSSTGCPSGQWCSFCWGHMACIPNGALC